MGVTVKGPCFFRQGVYYSVRSQYGKVHRILILGLSTYNTTHFFGGNRRMRMEMEDSLVRINWCRLNVEWGIIHTKIWRFVEPMNRFDPSYWFDHAFCTLFSRLLRLGPKWSSWFAFSRKYQRIFQTARNFTDTLKKNCVPRCVIQRMNFDDSWT